MKVGQFPYGGPTLPPESINSGLSNILARTARLHPHWHVQTDPNNSRGVKQIIPEGDKPGNPTPPEPPIPDRSNATWLDRARLFQEAVRKITPDFGAVDLSINDLSPEPDKISPAPTAVNYPREKVLNYCERQGRCNIGCLPGARHTLNKQLMAAAIGRPHKVKRQYENMTIRALAEVNSVRARPGGGYEVSYDLHEPQDSPKAGTKRQFTVTADVVIVAAGCIGTTEIMFRSRNQGGLPNLSETLGFGFSTNGDYIAFLEKTKHWVSLTRGPVTTSFAHLDANSGTNAPPEAKSFHTLEDQGIPPALASIVGQGVPLIRALERGERGHFFILHALLRWGWKRLRQIVGGFARNYRQRGDIFASEEEITARMMCVAAMGREEAIGQFRPGTSPRDSSLRLSRERPFPSDPIYAEIRKSLAKLAPLLRDPSNPEAEFINPFHTGVAGATNTDGIAVSHPLGGCIMGQDPGSGVVDQFGRVFDTSKSGERAFYDRLYISDASIIPTSLGVNPSLTISALALRIADTAIAELPK